jgi:hypothetical protein
MLVVFSNAKKKKKKDQFYDACCCNNGMLHIISELVRLATWVHLCLPLNINLIIKCR